MITAMPGPLLLAIYALAVTRLTGILVLDEISRPAREWVILRVHHHPRLRHWAGYLFGLDADDTRGCPWCASVWVAIPAAPLIWWHAEHPAVLIPALALALSQVVGMIAGIGRG